MANPDYTEYRRFLQYFAANIDDKDQLPVRVAGYSLTIDEVPGETIDWTMQYLSQKNCPPSLYAPIIRIILDEIKQACNKQPIECGYNSESKVYRPLKLMHTVTAKVNDVCRRLLDNSQLDTIPPPPTPSEAPPKYSVSEIRNGRRKMEDRHVCIDNFNHIFNIEDTEKTSYYSIFDGHAGQDAASYSVSHLHYNLANSVHYPKNPKLAIRDAFLKTDLAFIKKCQAENLCSGTTALCALYRPYEKRLYVGWVGDSQALMVRRGKILQIVNPHRPDRESEKQRIEKLGGVVMLWNGTWRVNGQLAISRAIGDSTYKPFVTGEPDIECIPLDGEEDFLIMACDGLWDYVTEDDAAVVVYRQVRENPDNIQLVTDRLVELSKVQGSTDNISVIVVFLKDPHQLATASWPSAVIPSPLDNMETTYDSSNGSPFSNANQEIFQQPPMHEMEMDVELRKINDGLTEIKTTASGYFDNMNNIAEETCKEIENLAGLNMDIPSNSFVFGTGLLNTNNVMQPISPNKKRPADVMEAEEDDEEEDLGPETDVDALDEIMLSPSKKENKEIFQYEHKEIDVSENPFASPLENLKSNDLLNNPFFEENDDCIVPETKAFYDEFTNNNDICLDNKIVENNENLYETNKDILDELDECNKLPNLCKETDDNNEVMNLLEKRDNSIEKEDSVQFENKLHDEIVEEAEVVHLTEDIDTNISSDTKLSDDEWTYIKGEVNTQAEEPQTTSENSNISDKNIIEVEKDKEEEEVDEEKTNSAEYIKTELISSSNYFEEDLTQDKEIEDIERNSELDDMMASQLNPDAKEFVPCSPQRTTPTNSPFGLTNGGVIHNQNLLIDDTVVAQSPRKGTPMDNIQLPSENEFGLEILKCPAEINEAFTDLITSNNGGGDFNRPGSSCSQASYQEMNLKEAMHGDEKKEYAPESEPKENLWGGEEKVTDLDQNKFDTKEMESTSDSDELNVDQVVFSNLSTMPISEQDPMNMSFYQDREEKEHLSNPFDMNAVQRLPIDDEFDDEIVNIKETSGEKNQVEIDANFNDVHVLTNGQNLDHGISPQQEHNDLFNLNENMMSEQCEAVKEVYDSQLEPACGFSINQESVLPSSNDFLCSKNSLYEDFKTQHFEVLEENNNPGFEPFESKNSQIIIEDSFNLKEDSMLQENNVIDNEIKEELTEVINSIANNINEITSDCVEQLVKDIQENKVETPPPTPAATIDLNERNKSPEPQKLVEAVEKLAEPFVDKIEIAKSENELCENVIEEIKEPIVIPEISDKTKSEVEKVVETAAVIAAATATSVAVAKNITASKTKPVDVKKIDSKSKPAVKSTSAVAKKTTTTTTTAPTTAARSISAKANTTTRTVTSPTKPVKSLPNTVAPSRPKTAPSARKESPSTIDHKIAPTSASGTLIKKASKTTVPLTNGDAKPAVKRTITKSTTPTVPKTSSPIASRSTATRTVTSTLTKSSAANKSTSVTAAPKPATATRAPITKPTTLVSKPKTSTIPPVASTIKATPLPRTVSSPTKPKASTSSSLADKSIKETTNKQVTRNSIGVHKVASSPKANTTSMLRKVEIKSPTTVTKTTTKTTTTVKSATVGINKKPSSVSTTATTTTRSSNIIKKPQSLKNSITPITHQETVTTTIVTNEKLNGDIIVEKNITETTKNTLINDTIDVANNKLNLIIGDGNLIQKNDQQSISLVDNSQIMVIDSAAD